MGQHGQRNQRDLMTGHHTYKWSKPYGTWAMEFPQDIIWVNGCIDIMVFIIFDDGTHGLNGEGVRWY